MKAIIFILFLILFNSCTTIEITNSYLNLSSNRQHSVFEYRQIINEKKVKERINLSILHSYFEELMKNKSDITSLKKFLNSNYYNISFKNNKNKQFKNNDEYLESVIKYLKVNLDEMETFNFNFEDIYFYTHGEEINTFTIEIFFTSSYYNCLFNEKCHKNVLFYLRENDIEFGLIKDFDFRTYPCF